MRLSDRELSLAKTLSGKRETFSSRLRLEQRYWALVMSDISQCNFEGFGGSGDGKEKEGGNVFISLLVLVWIFLPLQVVFAHRVWYSNFSFVRL